MNLYFIFIFGNIFFWYMTNVKHTGLILGLRPTNERRRYKVSHWLGTNLKSALSISCWVSWWLMTRKHFSQHWPFVRGIHPWWSFDAFFVVRLGKLLNEQLNRYKSEMPWCPCDATVMMELILANKLFHKKCFRRLCRITCILQDLMLSFTNNSNHLQSKHDLACLK